MSCSTRCGNGSACSNSRRKLARAALSNRPTSRSSSGVTVSVREACNSSLGLSLRGSSGSQTTRCRRRPSMAASVPRLASPGTLLEIIPFDLHRVTDRAPKTALVEEEAQAVSRAHQSGWRRVQFVLPPLAVEEQLCDLEVVRLVGEDERRGDEKRPEVSEAFLLRRREVDIEVGEHDGFVELGQGV